MRQVLQDLGLAFRAWRRTPAVALAAIVTLGLGIGVTSAIYSVGNSLIWRPLPIPDAERLTVVYGRTPAGEYEDYAWSDLAHFRGATAGQFDGVAALSPLPLGLTLGGQAERVWGEMVSANYFSLLGVPMALGRGFIAQEDSASAPPTAILSYALWQGRFHGDPAILGQTIRLNRRELTVVGVAAPAFLSPYYVGFRPAVWVPAGTDRLLQPDRPPLFTPAGFSARLLARLSPGIPRERAAAAVAAAAASLAEAQPQEYAGRAGVLLAEQEARPEPAMAADFSLALTLFLGVSLMVLLIACANVAGLLLSRAIARQREIAVRVALGAGRGRLVRQLLGESLLLAIVGGALGLGLGVWFASALSRLLTLPTDIPFAFDFALDARVIAFTAAVALGTTVVFGLVPALQATSPRIAGVLRHDAVGWRGVHRSRLRNALVIGQLALSCLLLTGAGLVTRSLVAMRNAPLGFETRNGLLVGLAPGLAGYDAAAARRLYQAARASLAALPGVSSATVAEGLPMEFTSNGGTIVAEGGEAPTPEHPGEVAGWTLVGDGYFATMGTRLLEGRTFGPGDSVGSTAVAVVSRTLAERLWPGRPALGRVVRFGSPTGPAVTVIGVAADAKYREVAEAPKAYLYLPLSQEDARSVTLVVRTSGDPMAVVPAVRGALAAIDPDLPIADLKTMDALVAGRALLFPRVGAALAGSLGLLALLLAVVGLYGLVAHAVAQRTRELGIRMALGATPGGVLRLVLREGLALAGLGILLGMAGALALGGVLRGFLFEVSPFDPLALAGTAGVLGAVALTASAVPAIRAGRVHPMTAIRSD